MKDLEYLDLSGNKLIGGLPSGLARKRSNLYFQQLLNDTLKGKIFPVSADIKNFKYLYLNENIFLGPILQKLSTGPLSILDLSCNNFSGKIPMCLGNIRSLTSLEMSTNHFNSHIPPDYCRLEGLEVLDLSENNLVGML